MVTATAVTDMTSGQQLQGWLMPLGLTCSMTLIPPLLPVNAVTFTYTPGANGTDEANVTGVTKVFNNGSQV